MENNNNLQLGESNNNADKLKQFSERFRALPKGTQIAIVGGAFFFILMISRGGSDADIQPTARYNERLVTNERVQNETPVQEQQNFEAVDPSRESLQRGFFTQQRKELAELRQDMATKVDQGLNNMVEIKDAVTEQQRQMQQMIDTFNAQIRAFEESNAAQRGEIARLVEEARQQETQQQQELGATATPLGQEVQPQKKKRISQTPISSRSGGFVNPNQALLNFRNRGAGSNSPENVRQEASYTQEVPEPFLPPLGFVKGTMLNGVDALVGRSTPSLVRLQGVYRTAMNSTVSLEGCVALIEFEGEISTERAIGKPSRMTCVYPDRGAVTYDLTGYVVDAQDGIVGVPGIFYEGDASRIAAALAADMMAGIGAVVEENQFTEETSDGGIASNLTGSAVRAEIANGVQNTMESLRDYLFERANRVVPFVRVDATRDIHVVLLSGIELRDEGSPWTLLVSGQRADQVNNANRERAALAEANQSDSNQ